MKNYQPPKAKASHKQQLSLHSQHFQKSTYLGKAENRLQ